MEWLKNILNQAWLATLVGIGGIIFGVYQTLRRKRGKLVYQTKNRRLIGGEKATLPEQVEVTYNDERVPRLSSTRVTVWNSGRSPIRRKDISESDPLRLVLDEDSNVLDVEVLRVTRDPNDFEAFSGEKNNSVLCSFSFLDRNDGATFEVLHTGPPNQAEMKGTLIGLPEGAVDLGTIPPQPSRYQDRLENVEEGPIWRRAFLKGMNMTHSILFSKPKLAAFSAFLIAWGMLSYGLFPSTISSWLTPLFEVPSSPDDRSFFLVIGGLYLLPPAFVLWRVRRRFPKDLHVDNSD